MRLRLFLSGVRKTHSYTRRADDLHRGLHTTPCRRRRVTRREGLAAIGVVGIVKYDLIAGPVDGPDCYMYFGHLYFFSFVDDGLLGWPRVKQARELEVQVFTLVERGFTVVCNVHLVDTYEAELSGKVML